MLCPQRLEKTSIYNFEPKLTEIAHPEDEMAIFGATLKSFQENKVFQEKNYSKTKDEFYSLGRGKDNVRITYQEVAPG